MRVFFHVLMILSPWVFRHEQALKGGRNGVELMSSEDMVAVLRKCYETYGKVFCFNIGKTVRLSIADPHLIKDILALNVDSYTKPLHIRVLGLLGNGLFASSGNVVWAPQRQLFNPALHNKEVKVTKYSGKTFLT